jgi:hypothetical protein
MLMRILAYIYSEGSKKIFQISRPAWNIKLIWLTFQCDFETKVGRLQLQLYKRRVLVVTCVMHQLHKSRSYFENFPTLKLKKKSKNNNDAVQMQ